MLLAVPSLEEQQRIADTWIKVTEIDGLIELQEQMIAQLTDYKQSVIMRL
jgi:restriction endonuclease S subunit